MADTSKPSLWLQLYFVLASLIGLIMLVVGSSSLINTALTSTLLKTNTGNFQSQPPQPYLVSDKLEGMQDELSEEDRQALAQWRQDYKNWQDTEAKRDYQKEQRNQSIAWALALILTGAPVFFIHAPFVFRQAKH